MGKRTCIECGQAIDTTADRRRKYCSDYCCRKRNHRDWRERGERDRQSEYYDRTCIVCSAAFRSSRKTGKFCSDSCKTTHYRATLRTKCQLPDDHPVIVRIAEAKAAAKAEAKALADQRRRERERSQFEWRTARECPGCACMFTPLYTSTMLTCSRRCSRRVARWRRNAAERNAMGSFTWSEFMRVARRFDYRCAYCGCKAGQLDPDHVVPLSRGGSNSTTNLLPSCRVCNGDKRDLLLDEWEVDRALRGKPPRATSWSPEDKRYWHLTDAVLCSAA